MAEAVKPLKPTNDSELAEACKLVQVRLGSALALSKARPNEASLSCRPMRSADAPLMPTKAEIPVPPTNKASVATVVLLARVTVWDDDSKAMLPLSVMKSYTVSCTWPEARVRLPRLPLVSSVTVEPGPVSTSSERKLWSITTSAAPPTPATPRLISTDKSLAWASKPDKPTKATDWAWALRLVNWRAGALPTGTSLIRAKPKSTPCMDKPIAWVVPPWMPAKASTPWPPMVSKLALILVGALALAASSEKLPSLRKNSS